MFSVDKPVSMRQRLLIALVAAGYTTRAQIEAATDEELLDVPGIGDGSVTYLRDSLAECAAPPGDGLAQQHAVERLAALIEQAVRRNRGDRALP